MTIPIIAAVAGAVLIILQALLMILVGIHRIRNRINLGTGDDPALERKIRRHGNLAENAALFIVVLALAEMTVVPNDIVAIIALIFIAGRILHAMAPKRARFSRPSGRLAPSLPSAASSRWAATCSPAYSRYSRSTRFWKEPL